MCVYLDRNSLLANTKYSGEGVRRTQSNGGKRCEFDGIRWSVKEEGLVNSGLASFFFFSARSGGASEQPQSTCTIGRRSEPITSIPDQTG